MPFDDYETTDGQPIELLTLRNGLSFWRYTNAARALTIGAFTFEPLSYTRTEPVQSKNSDDAQISIEIPGNIPFVRLYTSILTSNISTITIERFHNNDPAEDVQVYWKGEVGSVSRDNAMASILGIPLHEGGHEMPPYTFQGLCPYFLFQDGCGLSKENFRFETTVTSVSVNNLEITLTGLRARAAALDAGVNGELTSDELDVYWLSGYLETATEFRPIMEGDVGGDPDIVRVNQPFLQLEAGDSIIAYAGCDRTITTCASKFDNAINFGGFPYVPEVNPFRTELPPGTDRFVGDIKSFFKAAASS